MKFVKSVTALLLITSLLSGCNEQIAEKNDEVEKQSANVSSLIELDVTVVDVFFEESISAEPSVTDKTNKSQVEVIVEKSDGNLYITSKGLSNSVSDPGQLIVHVPKGFKIKAKGMSSNFRINSCCGTKIKVKSMSGDIRSNCLAVSETLFESMSGNVIVKTLSESGIHLLSSMSGDIDVSLRDGSTGKFVGVSEKGSVMINQEMKNNGKIIKELGNSEMTLVAETISGDVAIDI